MAYRIQSGIYSHTIAQFTGSAPQSIYKMFGTILHIFFIVGLYQNTGIFPLPASFEHPAILHDRPSGSYSQITYQVYYFSGSRLPAILRYQGRNIFFRISIKIWRNLFPELLRSDHFRFRPGFAGFQCFISLLIVCKTDVPDRFVIDIGQIL